MLKLKQADAQTWPGYMAKAYLNGELVNSCIAANAIEGWVDVVEGPVLDIKDFNPIRKFGKVEIILDDEAIERTIRHHFDHFAMEEGHAKETMER